MQRADTTASRKRKAGRFPASAILAFWQMRQVWRVFGLIALGMVAAVVLVGTVPLFALVNTTASVRAPFTDSGLDTSSAVQLPITAVSSSAVTRVTRQLEQDYAQYKGSFFDLPPDISIYLATEGQNIRGFDIQHIASHVHLVEGRMPRATNDGLEVVMTRANANLLRVHVGSTYTIKAQGTPIGLYTPAPTNLTVTVRVVGILDDLDPAAFVDPFWHGNELNPSIQYGSPPPPPTANVVTSNAGLLALFDQLFHANPSAEIFFDEHTQLDVFFPLNVNAITSENIGQLQAQVDYFTNTEPGRIDTGVFFKNATIDNSVLAQELANVGNQTAVVQVPVLALLSLMLGLILYFVALMTGLLVTRQAESIAIARSRGATASQVFWPFVLQSLLMGLLTVVIGPLLIPLVVRILVLALFPPSSQDALNVVPATLWGVLGKLGWYVWSAVIIGVLTMCGAVWRTLRSSTLEGDTLATAGTQRPLWQRAYADVLLALLGVLTYGLYAYLTYIGILDAQTQVLLAGPAMLLVATLLCLAGALLFLRAFPWLVSRGAKIAMKGRGIVPLFSLVMMARAPRQSMRTALLLVFTIAFALFAQVFLATQQQRTVDLATYMAGADVSGRLPQDSFSLLPQPLEPQEAPYQKIPGALSATIAYVDSQNFLNGNSTESATVIAADPRTFGSSVTWPLVDDLPSIKPVLAHLADRRAVLAKARTGDIVPPVPALVSIATKNLLHLSVGKTFFLVGFNNTGQMPLVDVGEVPYLPGVPDFSSDQGVLVDYDSFLPAYNATVTQDAVLMPTTIWVHVGQNGRSIAVLRRILAAAPFSVNAITSRGDIQLRLQHDPLYLNLLCTLGLGIVLTLLLAWIGCLVSAWLQVRARLRGLLVLRSLGTTPAQLALVLGWEQALIYATAIVLGVAWGAGFTALALPNVVFSGMAQLSAIALNIFQVQSIPLQTIIPATAWLGLGVVVLLCAAGIGLTATMIARLSPAQMLRLSEDYMEEVPLRSEQQSMQAEGKGVLAGVRQGLWREMALGRALTPVRHAWSALGLTQLGVLISVLFICVVPLFSQVAATAGLHDVLAQPENRYVTDTNIYSNVIPAGHLQGAMIQITNALNRAITGRAAAYFHAAPIISINNGVIISTHPAEIRRDAIKRVQHEISSPQSALVLNSLSAQSLDGQVRVLQGHTPQMGATNSPLQILLTVQAASYLHARVGDVLARANGYPLDMQLVGIFQPQSGPGALLTNSFFYYSDPKNLSSGVAVALTTTESLIQAIDAFGRTQTPGSVAFNGNVAWRYPLDQTLTSNQLDDLVARLSSLQLEFPGNGRPGTFVLAPLIVPLAALEQYQQSVIVSSIPILCTSVLIIALILLFLGFMVDLLVEREAAAIAVMRSRGATRRQIFAAFLRRTLLINGLGLLAGMVLAIPVVIVLTRLTLQPADQAGLNLFVDQPAQVFLSLVGFALISTAVTLGAMVVALAQATQTDYLSLRKETARAKRKPLWQRWYLDIVGMVLALTAYGYVSYLTRSGILDPEINVEVRSPLVLAATVCLVLTGTLFLLRLYPLLLRLGARLTMRNRGVEPMLALSQMARAPRQRLRTALLLMLTTAFVVFVVVFNASQSQHINDVAQYWAGADFSGSLPDKLSSAQAQQEQGAYLRVSGMTSVTLGHIESMENGDQSQEVQVLAVDARNFMQTVNWPGLSAADRQTLPAKLNNPQRFPDLADAWLNAPGDTMPAIVDAQTAQKLHLQPGQTFTLNMESFFEVAEVETIPTVNDVSAVTQGTTGNSVVGGILVDYQTYNLIYQNQHTSGPQTGMAVTGQDLPINYIWLKTDGSTRSLEHVRQVLTSGPLHLFAFYDRQITTQTLIRAPLSLDLAGILILGTLAPLVLTWIGCLMASWIDVRQRQLLFGVLRALGGTPRQLAKVLSWEQALIFGMAVILGTVFGLLTAVLALPSLVLTSVLPTLTEAGGGRFANGVQDLFSLQNAPAAYTVIPPALAGVVALLALLALLSVSLMTRSASRIALGQALRLNED